MSLADEMMIRCHTLSKGEIAMMTDQVKNNDHYKKLLLKYMDNVNEQEGIFFLDKDGEF